MKEKELEFQITKNKILSITDMDWYIDRIDAIYVRNSEMSKNGDYSIYIKQGSEIVELYFRTQDEILIAREYKKLCEAIKTINPFFDNSVISPLLINYSNLKSVELKSKLMESKIALFFDNHQLLIKGNKKIYNLILKKLEDVNSIAEV